MPGSFAREISPNPAQEFGRHTKIGSDVFLRNTLSELRVSFQKFLVAHFGGLTDDGKDAALVGYKCVLQE